MALPFFAAADETSSPEAGVDTDSDELPGPLGRSGESPAPLDPDFPPFAESVEEAARDGLRLLPRRGGNFISSPMGHSGADDNAAGGQLTKYVAAVGTCGRAASLVMRV